MTRRRRHTQAEDALLDASASLTGLTGTERHARLTPAVHDVLKEVARPGFRMIYAAHEGLHVYTPSGVWVWFCAACDGALEVLVTDTADEVPHPDAHERAELGM